ncbi:hypothetical protein B7486_12855 [cyanobacterium TDX16]|nr:hypothetical protein B7486_12855 [cyanobacterium TDX16]
MLVSFGQIGIRHRAVRLRQVSASVGCVLLMFACGSCANMAAAWANITGGDWIEAEYKLSTAPLLVLVDDRSSLVSEPKAIREVHQTISEIFLQFDVNKNVIPFQDWQRLQSDPKYNGMSARQIGERLGAEQVLTINVEKFTLQGEGGAPIFKGIFVCRVKVISTERKSDVRLWPEGDAGRRVEVETDAKPMGSDTSAADVAKELGIKMGQKVAEFFYGRREFAT